MPQPNVDPSLVEATTRDLWERVRTHQDILGTEQAPPWEDLPEIQRSVFQRAMSEVIEDLRGYAPHRKSRWI